MKHYFFTFIAIFLFVQLNAQDSLWFRYWTGSSAFTIPGQRFEIGILDESRYGMNDNIEISSYLLKNILMPNLSVKKFWGSFHGFNFATKHRLFYPSPFLRTIAREGTGGFISPEFEIPDMVSISNRFYVSYIPFKKMIFTVYSGINFALKFNKLDARTTIDLPYFYPRLAVFYNQPEIDAGLDFRGCLITHFGWLISNDNFLFFNTSENYFMESNVGLTFTSKKQRCRIETGTKLCYGKYLFGSQWHLLPFLSFAFKI
ncbi:MAG: hypothetical protein ACOYO1_15065 [Bacteroidales bacterium]